MNSNEGKGKLVGTLENPDAVLQIRRETILKEAIEVTQDREKKYGHPKDHFARTAAMITGMLKGKLKDGCEITPRDWAKMIICDKVSRDMQEPQRDNEVDIAGYARTMEKLGE